MKLNWCRYFSSKSKTTKYVLVLDLGTKGGLLYCLLDADLGVGEKQIIRKASTQLDVMPLDDVLSWLKANCPSAVKAFRTLKMSQLTIVKTYDVKN